MIVAYLHEDGVLRAQAVSAEAEIPAGAVWIDLIDPGSEDERRIEQMAGIDVPTREEMREIEPSSRLYVQNGARYMTASVLRGADTDQPSVVQVSFVLAGPRLITVRYDDLRPFVGVAGRLAKDCPSAITGEIVLMELLDAIVDRAADVLEQIGADVERISKRIFERNGGGNSSQKYRAILAQVGKKEGLVSSVRESLVSLTRLTSFLGVEPAGQAPARDAKASIKSVARDAASLADYATFLNDKLQFLLDATVGMVSLEQNNIIKIFAVLSVVFMPPTLIASIYGMNFQFMPELGMHYAYPLALVSMVVSAIMPYVFFKWRGWL